MELSALVIFTRRWPAVCRNNSGPACFGSFLFIFSTHAAPGRRGESQHVCSPGPEHTRGPDLHPVTRLAEALGAQGNTAELGLHASERTPAGPWRRTPASDGGAFVLLDGSFARRSRKQSLGNHSGVVLILPRGTPVKDSFRLRCNRRRRSRLSARESVTETVFSSFENEKPKRKTSRVTEDFCKRGSCVRPSAQRVKSAERKVNRRSPLTTSPSPPRASPH